MAIEFVIKAGIVDIKTVISCDHTVIKVAKYGYQLLSEFIPLFCRYCRKVLRSANLQRHLGSFPGRKSVIKIDIRTGNLRHSA